MRSDTELLDWLSGHQGDYTFTLIERDLEDAGSPILNACNVDHELDDYTYGVGGDLREAINICMDVDDAE